MDKARQNSAAENKRQQYRTPKAKVIFVKAQGVLCQSGGNGPMHEKDYGDGGFHNE